jgi:hypothetical protein
MFYCFQRRFLQFYHNFVFQSELSYTCQKKQTQTKQFFINSYSYDNELIQ